MVFEAARVDMQCRIDRFVQLALFLRPAEEILLQVLDVELVIWHEWHTLISLVYLYSILWLILIWGLSACSCQHWVIKCGTASMLNTASVECIERGDVTGPWQERRRKLGGPASAALRVGKGEAACSDIRDIQHQHVSGVCPSYTRYPDLW